MSKLFKIVPPIAFVVLLIVVTIEAYFLFSNTQAPSKVTREGNEPPAASYEAPTKTGEDVGGKSPPIPEASEETKQSNQELPYINTSGLEGTVVGVDQNGGVVKKINFKYDVKIIVKSKNNREIPFYFTDEEIDSAKIIAREDGQEKSIAFDDIKRGDLISIEMTTDETKDYYHNVLELEIVVIR